MTALFQLKRDRPAGVAGAATARDDGQPELDAALHQAGHLGLGVRREHDERILDAPVGGVGHVRHPRQAVELEVVLGRDAPEHPARGLAQVPHSAEMRREALHRIAGRAQQLGHQFIALGIAVRAAAALHLVQTVVQRVDQQLPALRVVEQVVLEIGIALHHPDVAEHLVQHARRAPGAPLLAQQVRAVPRRARPAGAARSRGRRTRCSCRESRAVGARRL